MLGSLFETYFRINAPIWIGRTLTGESSVTPSAGSAGAASVTADSRTSPSSDVAPSSSCSAGSEASHSRSSKCLHCGSRSFRRNITCVFNSHLHISDRSPMAQRIVRVSMAWKSRLRWLAPANLTMSSRCSCLSPDGLEAHKGGKRTLGRAATPSCSLRKSFISFFADLKSPCPHEVVCALVISSDDDNAVTPLMLRGTKDFVSSSLTDALARNTPPTKPFIALLR